MSVDAEQAKYRLLQFVSDAGVDVFLQTPVVEVIKDGARVYAAWIALPVAPSPCRRSTQGVSGSDESVLSLAGL